MSDSRYMTCHDAGLCDPRSTTHYLLLVHPSVTCAVCGAAFVSDDGGESWMCSNPVCPERTGAWS